MFSTATLSSTASTTATKPAAVAEHELVTLHPQKQDEVLATINMTVDYVLDTMVGGRPLDVRWKLKHTKRGIDYYVDNDDHSAQYRFCCVGQTTASPEDIVGLFQLADSATLLRRARVLYDNVHDTRVLSVLEEPAQFAPFKSTYIRYSSCASRDLCAVVATDVFTHEDGSTVGYCLWDSVDLAECPERKKSRSHMFRSGYFCRTITTGHSQGSATPRTEIVYFVGLDAGGLAPRFTSWLGTERFGATLTRLCDHFRRKKLDPATFLSRDQWPSSKEARNCRACTKKFSTFSKKPHCAACGDVFCSSCCSAKEPVDLPGVGVTTLRFCRLCLGRRGIEKKPSKNFKGGAASSSPSSSPWMGFFHLANGQPQLQQQHVESPFAHINSRSIGTASSQSPVSPVSPGLGRTIVMPSRW